MAGVHQQPDQSNYLAEGQIQTCNVTFPSNDCYFLIAAKQANSHIS